MNLVTLLQYSIDSHPTQISPTYKESMRHLSSMWTPKDKSVSHIMVHSSTVSISPEQFIKQTDSQDPSQTYCIRLSGVEPKNITFQVDSNEYLSFRNTKENLSIKMLIHFLLLHNKLLHTQQWLKVISIYQLTFLQVRSPGTMSLGSLLKVYQD